VHTLPLVTAIRTQFPSAYIGWAIQSAGASLIQGLEGLDALIEVRRDWLKRWSTILSTRAALREHRFDIAIDPQSLSKSSLLAWLSGARERIGFAPGQGRELSPYLSTIRVTPETEHVVDRYLELLRPLGIRGPRVEFRVPREQTAQESMQRFVSSGGLNRYALLNPGAGWNSKLWPHERLAAVANHLHAKHRLQSIVIWAGDREKAWAMEIVEKSLGSSILAPSTSLPELSELCRRAAVFVGSDTGPLHLAAAVGTSCVAMYGPTKISVCGPYGNGHEALQAWYQDGNSSLRRGDDNSAMRAILVEDVCEACDRIIDRQHQSRVA
jgi:ADP-heptose:LPS heptosyltransferase